ncbi:MAG: amidase [Streptosporangiales bacterium]|nr:amidase [Streptosporangiales bacterium]
MSESPLFWSVTELLAAYRAGELGPVEVAKDTLHRIGRYDGTLHAYLAVLEGELLAQAETAAAEYARGGSGPLLGVPLAIKDAFHVAGAVTTCGSTFFAGQVAKHDSGAPRRLRAAGALFVGKTNTPEFCQSATTDNLLGPDTANPWDPARTSGGSSGGSAAAVGAGMANAALGSDGGGSIRVPAAFTGLVGVKPTPGLCPDERGFATMSDFASAGPLARTVADARLLLEVLADRTYDVQRGRTGLRVGWCPRPDDAPVEPAVLAEVTRAAQLLGDVGHRVGEVDVPLAGWESIFSPLVLAEEHRERGHLLDIDPQRLTEYARRSLQAGRSLTPAAVETAIAELPLFRARVREFFDTVDVVVCPTVAMPAFPLGERPGTVDGQRVRRLWGAFPYTSPFNVAGTSAVTLPCGLVDGLPVGVQLVAAPGGEALLLDVAEDLEEALAFDATALSAHWPGSLLAEPA